MNDSVQVPPNYVFDSESDETNPDPRHQHRIALMQELFSHVYNTSDDSEEELSTEVKQILSALPDIDPILQEHAPERPLADINQVDLAILRIIMFESNHCDTPLKVLINEAVEMAKEFGTESSPRFVNGVLGKILSDRVEAEEKEATNESDS